VVSIGPFQGGELLLLFLIILLLLGPKKLPELARGIGEAVREFRKAAQGIEETPPQPPAQPAQPVTQASAQPIEPVKVVEQDVRRKT